MCEWRNVDSGHCLAFETSGYLNNCDQFRLTYRLAPLINLLIIFPHRPWEGEEDKRKQITFLIFVIITKCTFIKILLCYSYMCMCNGWAYLEPIQSFKTIYLKSRKNDVSRNASTCSNYRKACLFMNSWSNAGDKGDGMKC